MIKQRNPDSRVVAAEIDPVALACARRNGRVFGVEVVESDVDAGIRGDHGPLAGREVYRLERPRVVLDVGADVERPAVGGEVLDVHVLFRAPREDRLP